MIRKKGRPGQNASKKTVHDVNSGELPALHGQESSGTEYHQYGEDELDQTQFGEDAREAGTQQIEGQALSGRVRQEWTRNQGS